MPVARQSASEVMKRLRADPLRYIIKQFNTMPDGEPEKLRAALELLPYAYPKLRPKDPHDPDGGKHVVEIVIGSASRRRATSRVVK